MVLKNERENYEMNYEAFAEMQLTRTLNPRLSFSSHEPFLNLNTLFIFVSCKASQGFFIFIDVSVHRESLSLEDDL